ncbi:MAG: electron transport complex subunit RsxA [Spongiibacteraceae bacterium]
MEYILLLISSVFVNNVILVRFLGLCPFMGVTNKFDSAIGMGMATGFVLTLSSAACWALERFILLPLDIGFMRILSFILVIAAVVQFTETVIRKLSPSLYQSLGVYLPLITTNCAVLGIPLLNVSLKYDLIQATLFGFGSSAGFTLILIIFAGMRERMALANIPATFKGAPIAAITAGLLSLIFMGFSGLVTA